jgi:cbb3-type cytochrome oxidase subunit 3
MKKGDFLWSAYRITEKQKAGKARNIKEKQLKNSRNTVSRALAVHPSSRSADRDFKMPQNPGTMRFSGVFLFVLFWLNLTQPNRFYRGQLGDNSPFFVFMGQLRGQLLGIFG